MKKIFILLFVAAPLLVACSANQEASPGSTSGENNNAPVVEEQVNPELEGIDYIAGEDYIPYQIPNDPMAPVEATFCTMDAKICADGSAVGRSGPDCEFNPCPEDLE